MTQKSGIMSKLGWLLCCERFALLAAMFFLFWGFFTPEWRLQRSIAIETYEGLWRRCQLGECVYLDLFNTSGWFNMVQGLVVGSVGTLILASGCCLVRALRLVRPGNQAVLLVQLLLQYASGALCIAGSALYTFKTYESVDMSPQRYGQSYICVLLSAAILLLSACISSILFCHAGRLDEEAKEKEARSCAVRQVPYTSLSTSSSKAARAAGDQSTVDLLSDLVLVREPPDLLAGQSSTSPRSLV